MFNVFENIADDTARSSVHEDVKHPVQRDHLYSEDTCRIVYEMLVWVYLKYFRAAYSFVILQRHPRNTHMSVPMEKTVMNTLTWL